MGKRRLYELAQDRGLTTAELLRRLEQAGIQGKKPLSSLDEEEVEAALAQTSSAGASCDRSQEPLDRCQPLPLRGIGGGASRGGLGAGKQGRLRRVHRSQP